MADLNEVCIVILKFRGWIWWTELSALSTYTSKTRIASFFPQHLLARRVPHSPTRHSVFVEEFAAGEGISFKY